MFNLSTLTGLTASNATFGLDQRIGTGPFSFLFDPSLLSAWASKASIIYSGLVVAVMAAALLASKAEKRMLTAG